MRNTWKKSMIGGLLAVACAVMPGAAEARTSFAVNGVLDPGAPLEPGDYIWETEGVPPGRLSVVVDLAAQMLYAYRGGVEIGRAFIMYGADNKPTPTGTFSILEKKADKWSNKYDAPMPYSLRITKGWVAIHGSEVDDEYATHGCVGVPEEFAALLFRQARVGDPVLVTRGWRPEIYGS